MSKFSDWREKRNNKKREREWLKKHPEVDTDWATDITGTNFHPKNDPAASAAVDDSVPTVHVIPTYYEYDEDGVATGVLKMLSNIDAIVNVGGESITVYRQYIPKRDTIEYTVFFRKDGKKRRIDLELFPRAVDRAIKIDDERALETLMSYMILRAIDRGDYTDATDIDSPRKTVKID